ncbi:hypothetical protein ACQJ0Y_14470 [Peribacillus simplex]|uniref:hypothetical protein n=1 Tax=Peribacillus simplex TaxID=1478 RepID=UPI003CEF67DD
MNRKERTFLVIAGCFFLLGLIMFLEGFGLYDSEIISSMHLYFLKIKIAEGVTTQNINQYAKGFMMWSIIPLLASIISYRKFLKVEKTAN